MLKKRFLSLLLALFLLPAVAGCEEDKTAIKFGGYDHNEDVWVAGFTIDDKVGSGIGGFSCCVVIPRKWRPGLKVKISWSYIKNSVNQNPPPPQEAVVEIQEYNRKDIGHLDVHFYPGHKVKAIVTLYGLRSPFYPLKKEDWHPYEVDQNIINLYRDFPKEAMSVSPPTMQDRKWAEQWGLIIPNTEPTK
jgi:hypothetical protein